MSKGGVTAKRRACSLAKWCISFFNNRRRSIFGFLRTLGTETVPYVSIASLDKKPSSVDPARFSGLSHIHVIATQAGKHTLISYWKTRDHFERFGQDLYDSLGAMPALEGLVSLAAKPKKPWYKYITPGPLYSFLVTFAAIVAIVLAIRTNFDALFGAPTVEFERVSKGDNYLKNEPFTIDGRVRNIGSCNAKIDHIKRRTRPTAGIQVIAGDPQIGQIPPNQLSEIHVTAQGLTSGTYDIIYSARISNGFFRRRTWEGFHLKVQIWKDCEALKSQDFRLIDSQNCEIDGMLYVGRAPENGIEVGALLTGHPEISFRNAGCPGNTAAPARTVFGPTEEPAKRTLKILWRTGKVSAFTKVPFLVELMSERPLSKSDWEAVVGMITIDTKLK